MLKASDFHLIRRAGKTPVDQGWPRLTQEQYNDHRANMGEVGLVCGEICVLDVDVDKATGQPRPETMAALMALELPETLQVQTPSGGWHYFFHNDREQMLPRRIGIAPGIDWLGQRGYVALYEPLSQYDPDLMNGIPESVIALLEAPQSAPAAKVLTMQEGGRNDSLASLVGSWFKAGMPYTQVMQNAQTWAANCVPPLPSDEAAKVVASVSRYHAPAEPEPAPDPEAVAGIPHGESLDEFKRRDYKPLPPLCGPIQAGSMTLISGAHKAGKSLFAAHIAAHIARGIDFEHWTVPEAQRVLYIDGENPSRAQFERVLAQNFPPSDNFRLAHRDFLAEHFGRYNLTDPLCQEWLLAAEVDFLVLDSLTSLNPPIDGRSINDVDFIEAIMPTIDKLTARGVGVLVLHNLNKSDKSHGTNALGWRSDRLWHLYRRQGFKIEKDPPLRNHPDATAGLVLRALDGDRSLQETAVDSEWQFFMGSGWRLD